MKWLFENWSLIIVIACAVAGVALWVKHFLSMPQKEQIAQVKALLLYWVIEAEKELGGGTGALKLRYVYSQFVEQFPTLANIISFEQFAYWVDDALVTMRHLLETNRDIKTYVEG